MKLIDKVALVAKLRRRIQESIDAGGATRGIYLSERMKEDSYILSFIDTLEVKEVDLERLINDYFTGWYFDSELDILAKPNNYSATVSDVKEIAKHFFELGLKAQKMRKVC